MAWLESQNFAVVRTELDTVFFQTFDYDTKDPIISTVRDGRLFKQVTITNQAYIEEIASGVGLFPKVGEVQNVPTYTPIVANKIITPVNDYANAIEVSKNLYDDNMHSVWAKHIADFALKARVSQDKYGFDWFNNAFTTSLTADGTAFCGTHTLLQGGTQSNIVPADANGSTALSNETLNNAIVALRTMKDQAGVILGDVPSILLVPPQLFQLAIQLTQSALQADVANNAINVWRSAYGMVVKTSPYLTSSTAWFLLADRHSVTRIVRQGVQTALRDWSYSSNRTYLYQANFREVVYAPDYAGAVGASGVGGV